MDTTTFPKFMELAPEIRSKIWELAIATHVQDLVERLPRWMTGAFGRRKQVLIGNEAAVDRTALVLSLRDPYDGIKMCLEEDDFETLVDCLTITAVCREVRRNVAEFCASIVPHMWLNYLNDPFYTLQPPEKGAQPSLSRNIHCVPGLGNLEHAYSQPMKLSVNNAGRFKSADHLLGIVTRFFGNKVQHLSLILSLDQGKDVELAYPVALRKLNPFDIWSNPSSAPLSIVSVLPNNSQINSATICVTNDRRLHVLDSLWESDTWAATTLARHMLKIYEIYMTCLGRLPELRDIDVKLHLTGMDGSEYVTVCTTWTQGYMAGWYEDQGPRGFLY